MLKFLRQNVKNCGEVTSRTDGSRLS